MASMSGPREPQAHTQRMGKPKVGYERREDALAHRQKLLDADLDNGRLMTFVSIYECATCGLWHVGNAS